MVDRTCRLHFQVLPHGEGLDLPAYKTSGAAGLDLRAAVTDDVTIEPFQRLLVPTGLKMAIPEGYEGQVRPRSGLALKQGLSVLNSPGTIDSDYRGEVGVILINLGTEPIVIHRGLRMAQLVIAPIVQPEIEVVASLDNTERGAGGFGSTGVH